MSEKATEFFRKERLAFEQEAKRVKEQNKALNQELERVKVLLKKCIPLADYMMEGDLYDEIEKELTNNQ